MSSASGNRRRPPICRVFRSNTMVRQSVFRSSQQRPRVAAMSAVANDYGTVDSAHRAPVDDLVHASRGYGMNLSASSQPHWKYIKMMSQQ